MRARIGLGAALLNQRKQACDMLFHHEATKSTEKWKSGFPFVSFVASWFQTALSLCALIVVAQRGEVSPPTNAERRRANLFVNCLDQCWSAFICGLALSPLTHYQNRCSDADTRQGLIHCAVPPADQPGPRAALASNKPAVPPRSTTTAR